MTGRSLALAVAKGLPAPLKALMRKNRVLGRWGRTMFAHAIGGEGDTVRIKDGKLAGLNLAVSQHISHAHIMGAYEEEMQDALSRLLKPEFVCYDLGASIGYFSLMMAHRARQVFAFEPASHAREQVFRNADANGFKNITVVPSPVSDTKRTVTFSLTDVAYGSCIREGRVDTRWKSIELETVVLDEFASVNPMPDLMKIDIEGEEGRALAGAQNILRTKKPLICCEIHHDDAARQVHAALAPHGYRITRLNNDPIDLMSVKIGEPEQIMALPQ